MEKNNPGAKKYHQNRLTLNQVENHIFNNNQQTTYYFVNRTPLTAMEKFVINYILNFTQNGQPCHTPYKKIAFAGGYKVQSIEPCISKLTKAGLVVKGKQVANKDNKGSYIDGGLAIDLNNLITLHKEYNDTHSYEAMEAEYKAYQDKKRTKRESKLAAKDAEIENLKKLLAQHKINSNDTRDESSTVERTGGTHEEVTVSENVEEVVMTPTVVEPVNSDNTFNLTFNGKFLKTVNSIDDLMKWLHDNGETLLAQDYLEKVLFGEEDGDGTCSLDMTYKEDFGELIIEAMDQKNLFIRNKSA